VFESHLAKIGLLGNAAAGVIRFYAIGTALVEDLTVVPSRHRERPLTKARLVTIHSSMVALFKEILVQGEAERHELGCLAQRRFMRTFR
jgi:hypothetical protein